MQGKVEEKRNIAVGRSTAGLIPCANEDANPRSPRSALRRAGRLNSLPPRKRGETHQVDRRVVFPEDSLLADNGKGLHHGSTDAGTVGGRLAVANAFVPAVVDLVVIHVWW